MCLSTTSRHLRPQILRIQLFRYILRKIHKHKILRDSISLLNSLNLVPSTSRRRKQITDRFWRTSWYLVLARKDRGRSSCLIRAVEYGCRAGCYVFRGKSTLKDLEEGFGLICVRLIVSDCTGELGRVYLPSCPASKIRENDSLPTCLTIPATYEALTLSS